MSAPGRRSFPVVQRKAGTWVYVRRCLCWLIEHNVRWLDRWHHQSAVRQWTPVRQPWDALRCTAVPPSVSDRTHQRYVLATTSQRTLGIGVALPVNSIDVVINSTCRFKNVKVCLWTRRALRERKPSPTLGQFVFRCVRQVAAPPKYNHLYTVSKKTAKLFLSGLRQMSANFDILGTTIA